MYPLEALKTELPYYQEVIRYYLVNPCLAGGHKKADPNHNQFFCFNYHNPNEKRRLVYDEETSNLLYQPIKCPFMAENKPCPHGDLCKFAHTQKEMHFHPLVYKTDPCCGCYLDKNSKFCPFYHSDEVSRKANIEKSKTKMPKDFITKPTQNLQGGSLTVFNLDNFKAKPCLLKGNHNPKVCEYYHHDNDKKRPVSVYNYSPNLCRFVQNDEPCPKGDNCGYCHNKVEQLYHPDKYKKKFCLCHPHNVHKCEYGNFCSFAHSESEIQIELLHNIKKDEHFYLCKFKTVFCPYIYEHDRNQCVYAHNPQDLRRDPTQYKYNPVQCPHWTQRQIFSYEEGCCPKGMQCDHCHGWKELEYHPFYYRTKPCNNGKKCNKKDCPFYHTNTERRDARPNSQLTQTLLPSKNQFLPQQKIASSNENEFNVADPKKQQQQQPKFGKNKESNFSRPIGLFNPTTSKSNEQTIPYEPQQQHHSSKHLVEPSTTHTSNISSMYSPDEEIPFEESKKKKGKGKSFQSQKEKRPVSRSAKSDKPIEQFMKDVNADLNSIWEPSSRKQEASESNQTAGFEFFSNFKMNQPVEEAKGNDSFESLHSLTVEKNFNSSEKQTGDQFRKSLFARLSKKGLDHAIPSLQSSKISIETLKSFGPKDFDLLPQITHNDKEKIARIILDILEGEAIFSEINTIHEEPLVASLPQNSGFLYSNFGTYDSNNDFNDYLKRHSL